jgi:CsoR family transcriptional regulator, copper-sensing transcriptional repressor
MAGAHPPLPPPRGYDGCVKPDTKKDVAARLRSIAGHLKAVERMVDEDKYCVDVLKQTMAIEKALERVDAMILGSHLETCVADAFREGRAEKTVQELAEIFSTARK